MNHYTRNTPESASFMLKIPFFYTLLGLLGVLIGGIIAYATITGGNVQPPPLIAASLFALAGLYLVCAGSTTVRVEGQVITTTSFCCKPRQIETAQITRIKQNSLMARLTLFGAPTAHPVHLDYQLNDFGTLVTWLWTQRPDLWTETRQRTEFRRTPLGWLVLGGGGALLLLAGLFLPTSVLWARLGLIGLSLFAFLAILPEPTALTIEHHGLTFKYLLRQEHVPFTNIVAIGLSTQNGYPVIWLKLTNRKHMQLGGYAGGAINLYIALLERLLDKQGQGAPL
jgi:hypothetical protein